MWILFYYVLPISNTYIKFSPRNKTKQNIYIQFWSNAIESAAAIAMKDTETVEKEIERGEEEDDDEEREESWALTAYLLKNETHRQWLS